MAAGTLKETHWALWVAPAVMLCGAVLPLPYGYYQLLRIVVFGCAAWIARGVYLEAGGRWTAAALGMAGTAALLNPIVPIHLSRDLWLLPDLLLAVFFLLHLRAVRKAG
jgi:hypothetical protein